MLIREAVLRFNKPIEIDSTWVIVLAAMSILVNGGSVLLLRKESRDNMNMKSAYLHLFSDMITSVAVLAGGIGMYFWKIYWIDSALSLAIAAYLIYSSVGLLLKTLKVLMQFAPSHIDLEQIKKTVTELSEVDNMHHMHLWQLNDNEIYLEAHIDFTKDINLSQVCRIIKQIRLLLKDSFNIYHTTLQPEFGVTDSKHLVVEEC
jgi:cobalt-zinc-cadmium efflux system protein